MGRWHRTLEERLKEDSRLNPDTGCWEWRLKKNACGYGRISINSAHQLAHRVSYRTFVGPIPDGMYLDHLCRNRCCVNPAHLEPVTPRENALRGIGPAAQRAAQTHCVNGHAFDEQNTRLWRGNRYCRACNRAAQTRRQKRLKCEAAA